MKLFYTSINKFMWKHSFIKSCVHFASKFCPYIVAIFYSLFLLKIFLNKSGNMLVLTSEPIAVQLMEAEKKDALFQASMLHYLFPLL